MNGFFLTGYLPEDAVSRTRPAKGTSPASRELAFKIAAKDAFGLEHFFFAVVDAPHLVAECEPMLTRGRAVVCVGQLVTKPFIEFGREKYRLFTLHVTKVEFVQAARLKKEAGQPETEEEPASV